MSRVLCVKRRVRTFETPNEKVDAIVSPSQGSLVRSFHVDTDLARAWHYRVLEQEMGKVAPDVSPLAWGHKYFHFWQNERNLSFCPHDSATHASALESIFGFTLPCVVTESVSKLVHEECHLFMVLFCLLSPFLFR